SVLSCRALGDAPGWDHPHRGEGALDRFRRAPVAPAEVVDASDDSLPSEVKEPFVFYEFQRERATGVEPATSSLGSFLGPCGARVFRRRYQKSITQYGRADLALDGRTSRKAGGG